MEIFISYASENKVVAERIALALMTDGHTVFVDRAILAEGKEFDKQIQAGIARADVFVFLISPDSVRSGSYARTELKFAQKRWPHPRGRVLPVVITGTEKGEIPAYLRAVTWLEPDGDVPAEVLATIAKMQADRTWYVKSLGQMRRSSWSIAAAVLAFAVGLALGSWDRNADETAQRELLLSTGYRVEDMAHAHNVLVARYFDEVWRETERFIEEEWLPEFSRRVHGDDEVREALASGDADAFVDVTAAQDAELRKVRDEMREQHEHAKRRVQASVEGAYGDIREAHSLLIRLSEGSAGTEGAEQLNDLLQVTGEIAVNQEMQDVLEELQEKRPD